MPSQAAEFAVFEYNRFLQDLQDYSYALKSGIDRTIRNRKLEEKRYTESLKHLSPLGRIRDRALRSDQYQELLQNLMDRKLSDDRHRLEIAIEKLKGLSPLDRLKSGYSYVSDSKGGNIRSIEGVAKGDELTVYVSDGQIKASVTDTVAVELK